MKKYNTSDRLKQIMSNRNLKQVDILDKCKPICLKYNEKLEKNALSQYVSGKVVPSQRKLTILAEALSVSETWLMGYDEPSQKLVAPSITTDTITFPVIGDIAAGYDSIAVEDWSGETVEIPISYLKGRKREDFFVLSVKGNSMYPMYLNGDKVLILKQSTLNSSGDVGAILYDGDNATLKKIEYVTGEDWLRLVPVNPEYQPKRIEGSELEQCRVIGIPKLLVREINE